MDSRFQAQSSSSSYMARPAYPQTTPPSDTSATSSVFQSSSSLHSLSSQAGLNVPYMSSGAPATSPAAQTQSRGNYFPAAPQSQQQQHQHQHYSAQQTSQTQQTSAAYIGQRGGNGGQPTTAPFLQDFSLLAEAAKRAQMACLERDLGDCEL